ncbi:MAG: glycosyltransferase [bacterium]|nr:glycosyltransferase [bacterium]
MGKPIRILQVFGKLNRGGAEAMIMNIYRNINRDKIQFDFVVHGNIVGDYEEEIKQLGGKIYRVPDYKVYNHIKYVKAWNSFFKNNSQYRVIHSHIRSTASIILKIAKKYNLKTICHSHNTSNGRGIKSVIKKVLQSRISKYSDYMFACSKESAIWLYGKENANSNNCFIINNAIDSRKYIYDESIRNKKRKELKIEDKIVIGQVGRLNSMKNHLFSFNVLKECLKKNNKYVLLVVGDGNLKNDLKLKTKKLGIEENIIFLGVRSDVNELLQAMDVFIMPSLYEGLPVALVEAQAASLPCLISTNILSGILIDELIEQKKLSDNISGWSNWIVNLKKENRIDRSNQIKKLNFDINTNIRWLENFYIEID